MESRAARRRFSVVMAIALVALPLAAGAMPPGPPGPPGPPRPPEDLIARHARRLGLDEATQQAIQQIVDASAARDRTLSEQVRAARDRMRALLEQTDPDRDAVLAQADVLDGLMAAMHRNHLETILEVHALLTPAQREELVRIRDEERPRFAGGGDCASDLRTLCADATHGAAALSCLADHWNDLSEGCHAAVGRLSKPWRDSRGGPRGDRDPGPE